TGRLDHKTIQIPIAWGYGLGGLEMFDSLFEASFASGKHTQVDVRPGVRRIQCDGCFQLFLCFFATSPRRLEPAERRVVGRNIIEGTETVGPFIERACQRLSSRPGALNQSMSRPCFSPP